MKTLEIRSIYSPDKNDLESSRFEETEFKILVEIEVGFKGEVGSDLFSIVVISQNKLPISEKYICLHLLDYRLLEEYLNTMLEYCNSHSDPKNKLREFFYWEYEDCDA